MEMETLEPIVVHLWCGPRTLSTATMYSFSQRPDAVVVDEPLYAAHLSRNPQLFRPYRQDLLACSDCDGESVIRNLPQKSNGKSIVVAKHIAKQVEGISRTLLLTKRSRHVFIVRDPLDMILSWGVKQSVHQEGCTLEATALPQLVQLFSEIRHTSGEIPVVIDSNLLKMYPREILTVLCHKLGIPFYESQLEWPAGPKPDIDG